MLTYLAYFWIYYAYKGIWMHRRNTHILAYLCLLCTFCTFLICLFVHSPAYLLLRIAAYFLHIAAYLNLHIMAYLLLCIFKHATHMFAYKVQIYSYFENAYLCIFGFAYLYILLHIYAYVLFFGIFEHVFASKANQDGVTEWLARTSSWLATVLWA